MSAIDKVDNGEVLNQPDIMRANLNKMNPRTTWTFFHDFDELAIVEADSPFILNSGSDDLAVDPAINVQERGVYRLTAGDGDGTAAVDGSQFCMVVPVQADSGGLIFECRMRITDISECSCYVGFTDITTLEEPMSISGTTLTTNATDAAGFVYDSAMTTVGWFIAGVDTNVDATGSGASTATAPADAVYQVLRAEIASDGETAEFFVDGTSVGSLTAAVCDASTDLHFTVFINGNGTNAAAATADVDYVWISTDR